MNDTSVIRVDKCIYVGVCGTGVSTSARLVEQVLDRRRDQLDQFGAIALQDALPQSLANLLPASFPGERPEQSEQYVNRSLRCLG